MKQKRGIVLVGLVLLLVLLLFVLVTAQEGSPGEAVPAEANLNKSLLF